MVTLAIVEIIPIGSIAGAEVFNFFMNIIMYFGFLAFNVGLFVKVINRS